MLRSNLVLSGTLALALFSCSSDDGSDNTGGSGGARAGSGGSGGASGGSGGASGGSGGASGGAAGSSAGGAAGSAMGGSGGAAGDMGDAGGDMGGAGGMGEVDAGMGGMGGSMGGAGGAMGGAGGAMGGAGGGSAMMSFFVTSEPAGNGGNLGGLEGADAKCKALAMAISPALGAKDWKAYLSTSTVNARDRIGQGPWRNAKGEIIANSLAQLHDQGEDGELNSTWPIGAAAVAKILDEKGNPVPSGGGMPQRHDILTGSNEAGMANGENHCNNWTSTMGSSTVGHSNRTGGGRPPSWNSAHTSACGAGTGQGTVGQGGGQGSVYCFATN